jgi:hypothetical protein
MYDRFRSLEKQIAIPRIEMEYVVFFGGIVILCHKARQ